MDNYNISSRDYLLRAKIQLAKEELESLFYAAFEIRCGVEARMREYLEAQKEISEKKKKGWKISDLSRSIESVFKLGDKVAEITIYDSNEDICCQLRYTPVRKRLKHLAELLGNYLHSSKKFYTPDDKFWMDFRMILNECVKELEFSTSGVLLGPLLYNPKDKSSQLQVEMMNEEEAQLLLNKLQAGTTRNIRVRYFPSH